MCPSGDSVLGHNHYIDYGDPYGNGGSPDEDDPNWVWRHPYTCSPSDANACVFTKEPIGPGPGYVNKGQSRIIMNSSGSLTATYGQRYNDWWYHRPWLFCKDSEADSSGTDSAPFVIESLTNEWGSLGQYFALDVDTWVANFGLLIDSKGIADNVKVCRSGSEVWSGSVKVFSPSYYAFGNNQISTHIGRRDPTSTGGDWQVNDIIVPSSSSCLYDEDPNPLVVRSLACVFFFLIIIPTDRSFSFFLFHSYHLVSRQLMCKGVMN